MNSHRTSTPSRKATAHINNNDDQVLFIDALFLVTLFDCSGHYGHVNNQLSCVEIAEAFAHVRQIFESIDAGEFDNAHSVSFIRQRRLDTPQGVIDYLTFFSPSTSTKLPTSTSRQREYYFPYSIDLHLANDKICGGLGYLSDMEEHHIHVRQLTVSEMRMFLRFYAESIPSRFHDDLAMLTHELRLDVWYRTTPRSVCCLPNGMEAVTKLTKEYNAGKRAVAGLSLMDEPNQLPPTDHRLKTETWKRNATDRALENELGDGSKDDLEDVLWDGLFGILKYFKVTTDEEADKYRQQLRQVQEAEKLAQRNTAITEHMDKLRATKAATPHRKNEVQAIRQAVERRLREHYRENNIEVHLFGSFASGLCSMSSDADMTVYNLRVGTPYSPPIVELANALRRIGYQRVTSIPHAEFPSPPGSCTESNAMRT